MEQARNMIGPLAMVVAGAARGEPGRHVFRDEVTGAAISAFEFGAEALRPPE